MIAYPQTLPLDAAALVAEIVKKREVTARKAEFAHAGWNVQGYVQKVTLGDPTPIVGEASSESDEDATYEQVMETLLSIEGELDEFQHEGITLYGGTEEETQEEATSVLVVLGVVSAILQAIQLWRNRNIKDDDSTNPDDLPAVG